jgi:uncharacterized protein YacL
MRNTLHYVIGAMLIYLIGFATDMHTYNNVNAYLGCFLVSLIIGRIAGWMFEEIQKYFIKESKIDKYDIFRTMGGGLIGLIVLFILPSNILFTIFAIVTVIIMLLEFYFNFYLKLKK